MERTLVVKIFLFVSVHGSDPNSANSRPRRGRHLRGRDQEVFGAVRGHEDVHDTAVDEA